MGIPHQLTGKKSRRENDGSWRRSASDSVIQEAGTQLLQTYIGWMQEAVEEWIALRTILEVCAKETGYEGRRMHQDPWWRQMTAKKHIRDTLDRDLCGSKGAAATGIRQNWQGQGMGGGDRI